MTGDNGQRHGQEPGRVGGVEHGLERVVIFVAYGASAVPAWVVVDRGNSRRLLGIVRRSDMIRAYNLALTRRSA